MKIRIAVVLVGFLAVGVAAQRAKSAYKVSRLSNLSVAVSCLDSAKPEVVNYGELIVLRCAQ